MKIPMFIAATGVAAALVVPMASGSIDRSLPWDTTGQGQSIHHKQLSKKLKERDLEGDEDQGEGREAHRSSTSTSRRRRSRR